LHVIFDFSVLTWHHSAGQERKIRQGLMNRRQFNKTFVSSCFLSTLAAPYLANEFIYDIRRLKLIRPESGSSLDIVYWVEGEYISDALFELNYIFRDLDVNLVKKVDTNLIDFLASTASLLEVNEPVSVSRAFIADPETLKHGLKPEAATPANFHNQGRAIDILQMRSRSLRQMHRAAESCNVGGVGLYSSYLHIDSGPVKTWIGRL